MAELDNLYREVILEHYKNPRNKGLSQDPAYVTFHIKNPSCGDDITVQTLLSGDVVKDCRHDGHGCSICCASASVLTETMIGKTRTVSASIAENYLAMVSNKDFDAAVDLEEASVFAGVRQFPARVKCASIAWQAYLRTISDQK